MVESKAIIIQVFYYLVSGGIKFLNDSSDKVDKAKSRELPVE